MKQHQCNAGARHCARERGAWEPTTEAITLALVALEFRATLKQFVEQCCVIDPNARVASADLYRSYERWAVTAGKHRVMQQRGFMGRMISAGVPMEIGRADGQEYWVGLKLRQAPRSSGLLPQFLRRVGGDVPGMSQQ